jgi:hypothetical protein
MRDTDVRYLANWLEQRHKDSERMAAEAAEVAGGTYLPAIARDFQADAQTMLDDELGRMALERVLARLRSGSSA